MYQCMQTESGFNFYTAVCENNYCLPAAYHCMCRFKGAQAWEWSKWVFFNHSKICCWYIQKKYLHPQKNSFTTHDTIVFGGKRLVSVCSAYAYSLSDSGLWRKEQVSLIHFRSNIKSKRRFCSIPYFPYFGRHMHMLSICLRIVWVCWAYG